MKRLVTVGDYLFTRLRQLGLKSVHGVPGDYTLRAIDVLQSSGLRWIGSCNELNAGYAADGYAKVKGIGALFTTYGVGELSALNAVAGSFAEYSPVVHIVGGPSRDAYLQKRMVHHSLGDGDLRVYADIYKRFTVAQASLFKMESATRTIDRTLEACVQESRPVYIELPSDVVDCHVPGDDLTQSLELLPRRNEKQLEGLHVNTVLERIYNAKQPYILVDGLTRSFGIVDEVDELVRVTGFPTFSLTFGGGIVNGMRQNYHGVHAGKYGSLDFTPYTESADLALLFGPLLSDTNTQGWSAIPPKGSTIAFNQQSLEIGHETVEMEVKSFMRTLLERLDRSRLRGPNVAQSRLPSARSLVEALPPLNLAAPIDQDTFYLRISSFFKPNDIIVCANGTPLVGGRDFNLPPNTQLINSAIWLSVGHMLPATQGATLAQQELQTGGRTILFEGDGSFQATAQELSTIIRYKLNVYIFLINNDGYTFERLIHGMDAEYNDIARWRYLNAPEMFGAPTDGSYDVETHDVGTWGELQEVLASEKFRDGKGLKMVNVRMARDDVARNFKPALKLAGMQLTGGRKEESS